MKTGALRAHPRETVHAGHPSRAHHTGHPSSTPAIRVGAPYRPSESGAPYRTSESGAPYRPSEFHAGHPSRRTRAKHSTPAVMAVWCGEWRNGRALRITRRRITLRAGNENGNGEGWASGVSSLAGAGYALIGGAGRQWAPDILIGYRAPGYRAPHWRQIT